ncbi:MAG: autotransporter domain-containing protein [Alphaproteobacteria bacterium]|nr:autotransporter domain-containing protein [Alphaproteobacteria bacterium]
MSAITRKHITDCNYLEKHWGGVKLSAYSLLLSLFFTSASFAQDTTKKIDQEFLNSLTPDKVTWTTATDEEIIAGKNIALIDGVYYKYSYNKPSDYNETNKRLNNNLTTSNTQSVVFNNITTTVNGGAILNTQNFNNPINADFIGNYIQAQDSDYGGAIYNGGTIGDITGDFIGNYVQAQTEGYGGAIYNHRGTIGNITGDFIGNYVQAEFSEGGAIYNSAYSSGSTATISDITGDFIGNYIQAEHGGGGAIYNGSGNIGNITGDFIGNYIQAHSGSGGAIYNSENFPSSTTTIGNITGDFIGNYIQAHSGSGGAIHNSAGSSGSTTTIGDITGDFIGNYIQAQSSSSHGGAIYNRAVNSGSTATIGDITGDFIGNYIQSQSSYGEGGAIYNKYGTIGNITGDFIGNYVQAQSSVNGGAIYNRGTIGNISGDFIGNYIQTQTEGRGGAIYNNGTLSLINADFYDNYVQTNSSDKTSAQGGAIYNRSTLNITANDGKQSVFDGNHIIYKDSSGNDIKESNALHMAGGTTNLSAIEGGQIIFNDKITANEGSSNNVTPPSDTETYAGESGLFYQDNNGDIVFVNLLENNIKFNLNGDGTGKIVFNNDIEHDGNISIDNVEVEINAKGLDRATLQNGSVVNVGIGGQVKDNIINQSSLLNIKNGGHALSTMVANGGKLVVQSGGLAENSVVFAGGTLEAQTQARLHNLLAKSDSYLNISAGTLLTGNIIIDRHANLGGSYDYKKIFKDNITNGASLILEGGINNNLNRDSLINTAQDKKLVLSGGTFDIGSGANYVSGWKELSAKNNATVKLVADTNNKSQIASEIINMSSGSTLDLAGNSPLIGTINASVNNDGLINFSHNSDGADDIVTIKGTYHAYKNASMIIDVDPSNNTADLLIIEGDVVGRTKVVVRPTGSGLLTAKALFVSAPNDDVSTGAYFDVFRMDGDAREWYSLYENNKWYVTNDNTSSSGYGTTDDDEELVLGDDVYDYEDIINITSGKPKVVAEALAYMALPQIGLEQTRDLVRVIANKVASTKHICGQCGMGEREYDGASLNGAWINLGQTQSNIDIPIVVEAKIKAVDLGFDIQHNLNNRLGIFGSYRQGNYELSGEGKDYYSSTGSEYDIDSWILGLYHRYDKDKLWALSTVYGGIQQADMTTDDNVSSDTTGIQFGASIEAGMVFEPQKRLTVEPSIRLGYNFIKYDNMSDEYGKTAKFDNIHNIETEAGIKIEKTFFHDNKKHSISKIYLKPSIIRNFGKGDVSVTSLDSVEGVENQTLIRGEIGGSINIGNGWSGFGSAGYTFGSNYNASDFNLGINYNW